MNLPWTDEELERLLLEGIESGFEPFTADDIEEIRKAGLEEIKRRQAEQ
jgi:hypothetical protein